MAGSGTVGILRALLTADASAYQKTMKQSADATKAFGSSVTQLGNTTQKVTPQLTRLEKSFGGDKLLYTANNLTRAITNIGGASKLTAQEQEKVNRQLTTAIEKYRALGQTAPKAMVDLANATTRTEQAAGGLNTKMIALGTMVGTFASNLALQGVRALGSFALEAFETAGQITDLAKQTGLSTDSIQEMQAVTAETGQSLETFTNAAYKLGLAINGHEQSVGNGLRALGLKWEELRKLSMDEQFRKVMKAAGDLGNQVDRNRALVALFGERLARELSKAVDSYDDVAKAASKSSREQLEALDDIGDEYARTVTRMKTDFASAMGEMFLKLHEFGHLWARIMPKGFGLIGGLTPTPPTPEKPTAPPGPSVEDLEAQAEAAKKAAQQIEAERRSLEALGIVTKRSVNEALQEFATQQKRAAIEGNDVNRVLVAQLPKMEDLIDKMKTSGVESAKATTEYQRMGDAWRKSIDPLFDQVKGIDGLAAATKHLADEAMRLNGVLGLPNLSTFTAGLIGGPGQVTSQGVTAPQARILTFWRDELPEVAKDAFNNMTRGMSFALSDMLTGLRGFKQGFLDIWRSIQTAFSDILASMLNAFISGFLKRMFAAMAGTSFGRSVAGIVGGLGGGAVTAATAGGTAAAGGATVAGAAAGGAGAAGGGFGATLAALATNPFTIAAAGAGLLGLGIWKKGWFRGGEEGTKVNPARDAFLKQFGGFNSLAAMLTSLTGEPGGGRLFEALKSADTMAEFTSATSNILLLLKRRGVTAPAQPGQRWPSPQPALAAAMGLAVPASAMTSSSAIPTTPAAAPMTMNVTIQAWDATDMTAAFREEIIPRFKDALQFNQAGLRTAVAGV